MKKFLSIATATALLTVGAYAKKDEANATKNASVKKEVVNSQKSSKMVSADAVKKAKANAISHKGDVKIIQEAVDAVRITQEAVIAIDKKDKEGAIKKIEKALGKLEVVMSNPKAPALLPLDARVVVSQYLGTLDDIERAIITSVALLTHRKVQDARVIVSSLKDEIDFITLNMPLASYPAALKLAAKFLHENKLNEAKAVLLQALNTFVEVSVVTPIGIVQAEELIMAASKVAQTDKKLALSHLDAAKIALRRAEALGYTSRSDTTYKMLKDAINKLEDEIKGKNKSAKLFKELLEKIKEFKEKAIKTITK